MIAVDTSALLAIVLSEPRADAYRRTIAADSRVLISAGTLAEAMIVASGRQVGEELAAVLETAEFEVLPVTEQSARRMADAYARFGKGVHPARLNLGDCFAYEAAKTAACPLLYVGDDFSKTDIESAIQPAAAQASPGFQS